MGKKYYSLRINIEKEGDIKKLNTLLNVNSKTEHEWIYEIIEEKNDDYKDFINIFSTILNGKIDILNENGFTSDKISIWILYEYTNQCNLEFKGEELSFFSDNKICLCISCWEG